MIWTFHWTLTHHQHEEDQEHISEEVDRAPKSVRGFDSGKIKVSQNQPELGEAGVFERAELFHLQSLEKTCSK